MRRGSYEFLTSLFLCAFIITQHLKFVNDGDLVAMERCKKDVN